MAVRRPPIKPPDPQYWRRRANRRVRKARLARTLLRWGAMALANVLIAGLILLAGLRAVRSLAQSPTFSLEVISADGLERGDADALRERLAPFIGRNIFELDLNRIAGLAARDPWIRQVTLKRVLPSTLRVRIEERRPAAIALIDGLAHVVDSRGFVIGASGPRIPDDLPVLTGLADLEHDRLAAALVRGVTALARLERAGGDWAARISELDLTEPDRIGVRLGGADPLFLLDPRRVERNLEQFLTLRAEIEGRVGPAEYVDLRWDDLISVMPAPQPSVETYNP